MESLFACPNCGRPLEREANGYACPAGHRFDLAREGYVNLLPANFQHSKAPGDDKEMARARTRFLDGGWYSPLRERLCRLLDLHTGSAPALLDAGCGEGWYTAALARVVSGKGGRTAGVDLSRPSVKKAARRCPEAEIAVASVYRLPVADTSMDAVVNCFSPLAAGEFRRVIRPGGCFLYVVPGPRHLWELKQVLYDRPYENPVKEEVYPGFRALGSEAVETSFLLPGPQSIRDLFCMTPYYWKTPKAGAERLEALDTLSVTAQFRILCFRREESTP